MSVPREFPGYHDLDERLVEFRTEILTRMRRDGELADLPRIRRHNLAADPGVVVTVDSFLGTANTDRVADVYFPVTDAASGLLATGALPFPVESPTHPVLVELRRRFDLDAHAGSGTDLERAVRLRDWIKSLFPHRIPYRMPEWNAVTILDRGRRGIERFICIHYSVSLVQCCLALGLQARMINLHRGISDSYRVGDEAVVDPPVDEHVVAEVWCAEAGGWVMLDTDFDCHYERDGVALSAWDIHQALIKGELGALECRRGPHSAAFTALSEDLPDADRFFGVELPAYYAHVSVLMRNDFLGDPDGPVPVAHLTDAATEPIVWHRGSDMRLQPHLMGPVVVATPYTDRVTLLTDGNIRTGWASSDEAVEHHVEVVLAASEQVGRIGLVWPEYGGRYRTSRRLRIEVERDGAWCAVADVTIEPEGPFTLHEFEPVTTARLRVVQPVDGGFPDHPNRLWLNQVDVLAPAEVAS